MTQEELDQIGTDILAADDQAGDTGPARTLAELCWTVYAVLAEDEATLRRLHSELHAHPMVVVTAHHRRLPHLPVRAWWRRVAAIGWHHHA
jgi:hypothetical protein